MANPSLLSSPSATCTGTTPRSRRSWPRYHLATGNVPAAIADAATLLPFVGMGLTFFFKEQVYAGTIVRIPGDFQSIFFVQDKPRPQTRSSPGAFIFTSGRGSAYEAMHDARGYVWEGRLVQLGVRRWLTTSSGT